MNTKLKGDIAEQAFTLESLKRGWGVLVPIGDRLAYDRVLDVGGKFIRVQIKSSWWNAQKRVHVVESRRTCTNRRRMIRKRYSSSDIDFVAVFIASFDVWYIIPIAVFNSYRGGISLVEDDVERQRKPRSVAYREAWHLIK